MVNVVCALEVRDLVNDETCFIEESFEVNGTLKENSEDINKILHAFNTNEKYQSYYAYDVFFAIEVDSGKVLFDNYPEEKK